MLPATTLDQKLQEKLYLLKLLTRLLLQRRLTRLLLLLHQQVDLNIDSQRALRVTILLLFQKQVELVFDRKRELF